MSMLEVVSLVVSLVALGFAVVAVVRARSADESAAAAHRAAAQAFERAEVSAQDGAQALESAGAARADAATALDQATQARQGAVQARTDADTALERAEQARADAQQARADAETATGALQKLGRSDGTVEPGLRLESERVKWSLQQVKGAVWLMKNTGNQTANAALLSDATQPPKFIRADEVIPRDVPAGDHLQFRVQAARGGPPPRVRVNWREDGDDGAKTHEVTLLSD
jgi:hypothetical protein